MVFIELIHCTKLSIMLNLNLKTKQKKETHLKVTCKAVIFCVTLGLHFTIILDVLARIFARTHFTIVKILGMF